MTKITRLLILLAILGLLGLLLYGFLLSMGHETIGKGVEISYLYDFDLDQKKENIIFRSSPVGLDDGITEVFLNNKDKPELTIKGYFVNSKIVDITNVLRILEVEVLVGKSINSLIYRYENGKLIRVSVSTEKAPFFEGLVSRNPPEYKDVDNDGILEILVYYRYFPPQKKRTVEVYKFNGKQFKKQKEYEEETTEVYL